VWPTSDARSAGADVGNPDTRMTDPGIAIA
jgi:hypothetical protein